MFGNPALSGKKADFVGDHTAGNVVAQLRGVGSLMNVGNALITATGVCFPPGGRCSG
jgi:hypothetical protein